MNNTTFRALAAVGLTLTAMLGGTSAALADPADATTATPAGTVVTADPVLSNEVRLGLYAVFYHTNATDVSGPYVPPGVNLKANNLETLYIGFIRRITEHFQAELALGWPPLQKTVGVGPAYVGSVPYSGQVVATARWFAPTLLVEYNFFAEDAKFRPFIGGGLNYTNFYDRNASGAGTAAFGGPTKLSLTDSWGPVVTAGLTWHFKPRWTATMSYSWSRVSTNLTADTAGIERTSYIKFAPQALVISGGYKF